MMIIRKEIISTPYFLLAVRMVRLCVCVCVCVCMLVLFHIQGKREFLILMECFEFFYAEAEACFGI